MQKIGELIQQLASASQHFAEQWGGPGLMLIAFVDSSFFTLPEVADLLVVVFTIKEPDRWLYWAAMTTAGSLLGCSVLYTLARAGGRALVRSGFHERHLDRVLEWFRRHGALVLVIPALLPPPMPFKLFVFTAGVAGVRPLPFVSAIIAGRGLRYGLAAWLARRYGDGVFEFIKHDGARLIWPVLGIGAAIAIAYWWYRWRAK
jgi:membrane protein YqaA with SNARE-associated domain